jgi:hypothetical protein
MMMGIVGIHALAGLRKGINNMGLVMTPEMYEIFIRFRR